MHYVYILESVHTPTAFDETEIRLLAAAMDGARGTNGFC